MSEELSVPLSVASSQEPQEDGHQSNSIVVSSWVYEADGPYMYLEEHQCRRSREEYRTREGYIQIRVALMLILEDEQVQPNEITD